MMVLTYVHPCPPAATANLEQLEAFGHFESWRKEITSGMLWQEEWVTYLHQATVKAAEKQERAAQVAALAKWERWIHEGPAAGLRRQHRFSRTVFGWTPTAGNSGRVEGFDTKDEYDEVDGLTMHQLNQLKCEQRSGQRPASAQQKVGDQAAMWQGVWGKPGPNDETEWPDDMGLTCRR